MYTVEYLRKKIFVFLFRRTYNLFQTARFAVAYDLCSKLYNFIDKVMNNNLKYVFI
jgi:hypothetical protein